MTRVNIDILGISELKWTEMGKFNSGDHYIYYCGQGFLRRSGVALMVNKKLQNAVLGYNLKNDRMISVHFQGKQLTITVVVQLLSHVRLCDPMSFSMPGFPVLHHLPEFAQTHVP